MLTNIFNNDNNEICRQFGVCSFNENKYNYFKSNFESDTYKNTINPNRFGYGNLKKDTNTFLTKSKKMMYFGLYSIDNKCARKQLLPIFKLIFAKFGKL